jgi:hypothetical protein
MVSTSIFDNVLPAAKDRRDIVPLVIKRSVRRVRKPDRNEPGSVMATEANRARRKFKNRGDLGKRKNVVHDLKRIFRHALPLWKSFVIRRSDRLNVLAAPRARIANCETAVGPIFD